MTLLENIIFIHKVTFASTNIKYTSHYNIVLKAFIFNLLDFVRCLKIYTFKLKKKCVYEILLIYNVIAKTSH